MVLENGGYTFRVTWSEEDGEYLGQCAEFPSLSWLASNPEEALQGIRHAVAEVIIDLQANGENDPESLQ
jgi:predicted RNase H-like HicB family nuclease